MGDLAELLKDDAEIRRGDADAGVADKESHGVGVAIAVGPNPHLAALGELDRVREEIAQNLRNLGLVGVERRQTARVLEDERDRVADEQRAQHAAKRAEQVLDGELDRRDRRLARFDFRQVEQVVDQLGQAFRGFADELNLLFLLGRQIAVVRASSRRESARIEFSGVRNSWLMLERNFDFSSSARRRWSARSSSSA